MIDKVAQRVRKTIQEFGMLNNVRHLVLGFSGGPDSMCLFDVLQEICEEQGIEMHPVHVNHGIRAGVCDQEQEFCEEFSKARGLTCQSFKYDCESIAKDLGISTEEAGRKLRYQAFAQVAARLAGPEGHAAPAGPEGHAARLAGVAIAVAQNSDDQVETVLMRLIRGTGIRGMSGIPYMRDASDLYAELDSYEQEKGIFIIRPLLDVSKAEVLEYCRLKGLEPRIDLTNQEPIYQRNKIRLELLPYLEENYNPKIREALLRLAESAREVREYMEEETATAIDAAAAVGATATTKVTAAAETGSELDVGRLREMPAALRKSVIIEALRRIGLKEDLASQHILALEKAVFTDDPSYITDLPFGFQGRREYETLILGKAKAETSAASSTAGPSPNARIEILGIDEFRNMKLDSGKYAAFDYDRIEEANGPGALNRVVVRSRSPGDVMRLKIGTKKIQDILVDSKIPAAERDEARVAAIGKNVLWLIPLNGRARWTSECSIDDNTEKVLFIEIL